MPKVGDKVHIVNNYYGVDYEAIVIKVISDRYILVKSTRTGIEYRADVNDIHSIDPA